MLLKHENSRAVKETHCFRELETLTLAVAVMNTAYTRDRFGITVANFYPYDKSRTHRRFRVLIPFKPEMPMLEKVSFLNPQPKMKSISWLINP